MNFIRFEVSEDKTQLINLDCVNEVYACEDGGTWLSYIGGGGVKLKSDYETIKQVILDMQG